MHGSSASPQVIADVLALARLRSPKLDAADAARLVATLMGDRVRVGDASRYLVEYARSQGYDIPAFAYAGCGEIKQFFRDQGVVDVPGWYARIGVPVDEARSLYGRTLVEVRDFDFRRLVIVLRGRYHGDRESFVSLGESGLIERLGGEPRIGGGHVRAERGESLDDILGRILDFALRGDAHGLPTF